MKFNHVSFKGYCYALFVLLSILQSPEIFAQQLNSSVQGLVQNSKSEPAAGISVVIRNTKSNFTSGASTDSLGNFSYK